MRPPGWPVLRRRTLLAAAVAGSTAGLTGCVELASTGPVQHEESLVGGTNTVPITVYPRLPDPTASPEQIVLGFLDACAVPGPGFDTARAYLTARAARSWDPSAAVTVYDGTQRRLVAGSLVRLPSTAAPVPTPSPAQRAARPGKSTAGRSTAGRSTAGRSASPSAEPTLSARTTMRLEAPNVGALDRRGGWSTAGRVSLPVILDLVTVGGRWRLDNPPAGVVVSEDDFTRIWLPYQLLYPDPASQVLVADPVYLPDRGTPATSLLQALLAGPSTWLSPVVRRTLPDSAALAGGSVTLTGGLATVSLAGVPDLDTPARTLLAAQLVQTLAQVSTPPVTAVSVLVNGQPLSIAGVAAQEPVDSWARYSPDVLVASAGDLAVLRTGSKRTPTTLLRGTPGSLGVTGLPSVIARGPRPAWVATDPQSTRTLLVDAARTRVLAVAGPSAAETVVELATGVGFARPQIDRQGMVWLQDGVGPTARLRIVGPGPRPSVQTVAVATGPTPGAQVRRVWLSRDGQRAAVVLRSAGQDLLMIEKVDRADTPALTDPRYVFGPVAQVVDLSWGDAVTVLALVRSAAGAVSVVQVDCDGSDPVRLGAVPADSVTLTAGPLTRPTVVGTASGVILAQLETPLETLAWKVVDAGFAPVYPG